MKNDKLFSQALLWLAAVVLWCLATVTPTTFAQDLEAATMFPTMNATSNMTEMPAMPGTIRVNLTLSYVNVSSLNLTNATTLNSSHFLADVVPFKLPTSDSDSNRDDVDDDSNSNSMAPSEEEVDLLIQNTLVFYFGVYAEAYEDSIFAITPTDTMTVTGTLEVSDLNLNHNLTVFQLKVVTVLSFVAMPDLDELVNLTVTAAESETYFTESVLTAGPYFDENSTKVFANAVAEEVIEMTAAPTISSMPSSMPSLSAMPSGTPTVSAMPSLLPTLSARPSFGPSAEPSVSSAPSDMLPSASPSKAPSAMPSKASLTPRPTDLIPSSLPSVVPTSTSTDQPIAMPTQAPTLSPSPPPSSGETPEPTRAPVTVTMAPTMAETDSDAPTPMPTALTTTEEPTPEPTAQPTVLDPEFGVPPPADGTDLTNPDCSEDEPCGVCQGDCDSDDECESGLICFQRPGNSQVAVPGCNGSGVPGADYCVTEADDTLRVRNPSCSEGNPCAACLGDCDSNDQCQEGLVCGQRDGSSADDVPGCLGTAVGGLDYCHVPASRRRLLRTVTGEN